MKKDFEDEVDELKDFLMSHKPKSDKDRTSIIFDGKQYSVRIPKRFAEILKIDTKKDMFEFTIKIPVYGSKEKPELEGRVVREDG